MKGANSSKWMYMRSTADISLKWNDIRNAGITPNGSYMWSIADIPKISAIILRRVV
jgi:hypothetical protein